MRVHLVCLLSCLFVYNSSTRFSHSCYFHFVCVSPICQDHLYSGNY
uniref:Uncharacterized protein n=1 Tax=Rhizophora mucronata TaxID=61149 RepID=A0A2P2Q379_RHIMU